MVLLVANMPIRLLIVVRLMISLVTAHQAVRLVAAIVSHTGTVPGMSPLSAMFLGEEMQVHGSITPKLKGIVLVSHQLLALSL
mgnify:CR=1 FL=1